MFFSRTRPTVAFVASTLQADAKGSAQEEVRRLPELRALQLKPPAPACRPLIQDIKEVPAGRYAAFDQMHIPASFVESFALLTTGQASAVLLVAVEATGSHPQYELQRRVHDSGIQTVEVRQATREIIRSLHDANCEVKASSETSVEETAWKIIEDAIDQAASDIHIEKRGSFAQVIYRIFGERIEQPSIAGATAVEICNVLYSVHADADNKGIAWDIKTVQNTVIEHKTAAGKHVQLRFSSAPIRPSGNFHAVIRILRMDEATIRPMEDIGYTPAQVEAIEEMLIGSQGMVVLVGPTNSGKSTSMQSFIERIYQMRGRSIKVLTVEDPVEYILPNACQMGIPEGRKGLEDRETGSIFTTFIKGTLRQDPDVVMVGEIRDRESAEHVKHLVLAARKLLTTLHVYEVFAVFARLRELGVPDSVLFMEGFISGVICQRLVPELCPKCSIGVRKAYERGRIREKTYERVQRVADLAAHNVRVRGDGCADCRHMGIIGRTPCAEILVPDSTFLELMAQGNLSAARQHWIANSAALSVDGMGVSAVAHAIQKMKQGRLDPAHIEFHVGRLVVDGGAVHTPAIVPPMVALPRSLQAQP